MSWFEAIILGLVQGLTEFLPVSSSGHLIIVKELFGIDTNNISFEVAVHAATVMSTIVALRKDIWSLLAGFLKFKYNDQTQYIFKIILSMIPIMVVGLFFKDYVESWFGSGILVVGIMLLVTSLLLFISEKVSSKHRESDVTSSSYSDVSGKDLTYLQAFVIGLAQSIAVLPGLSRSGTTISTGLLLGVKKSKIAKFSFLMVLIPILGEAFLELIGGDFSVAQSGISVLSLSLGFVAAFISGFLACKWMIGIVRKAKLTWFSAYCLIVGLVIIATFIF